MWLLLLSGCKSKRDWRPEDSSIPDSADSAVQDDTHEPAVDRSLRFTGAGRVEVAIDDPSNADGGWTADLGDRDFTIELWLKASATDNTAAAVECGNNSVWDQGNVLVDGSRFDRTRGFGAAIAGNTVVFGAMLEGQALTVCGAFDVLDEGWHHVAVGRRASNGQLFLFIDGGIQAVAKGPAGDLSYPDDASPSGPGDPYLVLGVEKHGQGLGFSGLIDEVRISSKLRYEASFELPTEPFSGDGETLVLWHLNEGQGLLLGDDAQLEGDPTNGTIVVLGEPPGPTWSDEHAL